VGSSVSKHLNSFSIFRGAKLRGQKVFINSVGIVSFGQLEPGIRALTCFMYTCAHQTLNSFQNKAPFRNSMHLIKMVQNQNQNVRWHNIAERSMKYNYNQKSNKDMLEIY
jgi:hypothetical protein